MKLRESDMPEESYWETLLDVELILDRLGVDETIHNAVEVGCGYGTFTIPVARRISGRLETMDIEPAMVERTRQRVRDAGLSNIICLQRDVMTQGFGESTAPRDVCLLFNILHCEEPVRLLTEAAQSVRSAGELQVIHWRYDPATPRGPDLKICPRPEQILDWARQTAWLEPSGPVLDLPPWHYGLRLRRKEPSC